MKTLFFQLRNILAAEKTAKNLPELELNKCKSNDGTQIIVEKALEIIYDNWIYKAKI